MSELKKYPLWKNCLEKMKEAGMTFGSFWPVAFFEEELQVKATTQEFQFGMLALRDNIKHGDGGFFLTSEQNGQIFQIKEAEEMIDHALGYDSHAKAVMRYAVECRMKVLKNPAAVLKAESRTKLESDLEKASLRLLLVERHKTFAKIIRDKNPKLLNA